MITRATVTRTEEGVADVHLRANSSRINKTSRLNSARTKTNVVFIKVSHDQIIANRVSAPSKNRISSNHSRLLSNSHSNIRNNGLHNSQTVPNSNDLDSCQAWTCQFRRPPP